jgi:hypothetical protein
MWKIPAILLEIEEGDASIHNLQGIRFFHSEYGGSTFLRNVGKRLPDYTASHVRRQYFLYLYDFFILFHEDKNER